VTIAHTGIALLLASMAIAGCSNTPKPAAEANVMPTDYRNQIATYLGQVVTDRADFRNSMIGARCSSRSAPASTISFA